MIPFGIHCATISLVSHDKVEAFLEDIGHPEWGLELTARRRSNQTAAGLADEMWRILDRVDRNRAEVHAQIKAAQQKLLARTGRNLLHFGERMLPRAEALVQTIR